MSMSNFRYPPNLDAIQEDRGLSLTDMVKTQRMRNVRQVRSPENIHTPYAPRSQKLISNTDRALLSIMQDSREKNHKTLLKDCSFYQRANEKLCNHSSI